MRTDVMAEKGYHVDEYLWIRDADGNFVLDSKGMGQKVDYGHEFMELEPETEYVATEDVWITCRNRSIKIYATDSAVEVEIYELGYEDQDELASASAPY